MLPIFLFILLGLFDKLLKSYHIKHQVLLCTPPMEMSVLICILNLTVLLSEMSLLKLHNNKIYRNGPVQYDEQQHDGTATNGNGEHE